MIPHRLNREMRDIPILDHIIFPSSLCNPFFEAAANETTTGHESHHSGHFGTNETTFDVRMDLPAASGAFAPLVTVQARTSSSPGVRNVIRFSSR